MTSDRSAPTSRSLNARPPGPSRAPRVLVAIDSSPDGQLALELAAILAAQWPETRAAVRPIADSSVESSAKSSAKSSAELIAESSVESSVESSAKEAVELCGVFVEDDALRGAAALPFVHEIALHSARTRPFTLGDLEPRLEAIASQLRESLAAAARTAALRWSFMVRRGRAARVSWELARDADLVIVGGHSLSPSVARVSLGGRSGRPSEPQPLLVVHDGSPASTRLLDNAARLARRRQTRIELFLAKPDDTASTDPMVAETLPQLQQRVVSELAALHVAGVVHPTPLRTAAGLLAMARIWRPQLILVTASSGLLDADSLERFVLEHHGPIALWV